MAAPLDLPPKINFSAQEQAVLDLWRKLDAFKTSLALSEGKPEVRWPVGTREAGLLDLIHVRA